MANHSLPPTARHRSSHRHSRFSRRAKIVSGVLGVVLAGGVAYAVTDWIVGLANNSSGQAQSATVSNLTIDAVASPSPSNLLYPGATGDVIVKITNPNHFPVTITAVQLPDNTTFATGYTDSGLTTSQSGCGASTSQVSWTGATASSGSSHTLNNPIVVDADDNTTITFTGEATMDQSAPAPCESTYFSMPSLTGISASGGAASPTSFATDTWS